MTNVPVNGQVLIWARTERGLTLPEAAGRLGISVAELAELEGEKRAPTVGELRTMAAKYEIGFSALLMPEPLPATTRLIVQDFRTHRSERENWNPELLAELDDINILVDALADLRAVEPTLLTASFPAATMETSPATLAHDERRRVGLTIERQSRWTSDADAFKRLRAIVEAQGVFVYLANVSTTDDWRGLAIFDERKIPVIMINGDEIEPAARAFSLLHEYAHILLRQSAISDQRSRASSEIFCNKFAAYFLMPPDAFRSAAVAVGAGYREYWTDNQLRQVARVFHASMSAVALHLETMNLAPDGFFMTKWAEWRVRPKPIRKKGPVAYYEQAVNRLGARHIAVVLHALDRGRINQLDAYEMLDVQAANFPKLRSALAERQTAYGWGP